MLWDAICQFVPSVFYEPMNVCASKSIRTDVTYCINPPLLYLLEFLLYMLQAEVIRKNEDVLNMLRRVLEKAVVALYGQDQLLALTKLKSSKIVEKKKSDQQSQQIDSNEVSESNLYLFTGHLDKTVQQLMIKFFCKFREDLSHKKSAEPDEEKLSNDISQIRQIYALLSQHVVLATGSEELNKRIESNDAGTYHAYNWQVDYNLLLELITQLADFKAELLQSYPNNDCVKKLPDFESIKSTLNQDWVSRAHMVNTMIAQLKSERG